MSWSTLGSQLKWPLSCLCLPLHFSVHRVGSILFCSPDPQCLPFSSAVIRYSATPWTVAHQAPPSMGFSRQEYWSGLPFPSPGDLPDPGIELRSPAFQARRFTFWVTREAQVILNNKNIISVLVVEVQKSHVILTLPHCQYCQWPDPKCFCFQSSFALHLL